MGTSAAALPAQPVSSNLWLRALHGWHLLSLDAATVAFCWMLLFAKDVELSHALLPAFALACAVWLIYAGDRLLDARELQECDECAPHVSELSRLYHRRRREFATVCAMVAAGMLPLLHFLPRALLEAWLLLAFPLMVYAIAVHARRLPARWKATCVGVFFAAAVALPVAVKVGGSGPLFLAAACFGALCFSNCIILSQGPRHVPFQTIFFGVSVLVCLAWTELREVAFACGLSFLLLSALRQAKEKMHPMTFRALADAALVVPVLVLLGR